MTHPKRASKLGALRASIPGLIVVTDPAPDEPGQWSCAREAWQAYGDDATHHLVIEDDAVPCAAFSRAVERVVAARPEHALGLWANHRAITDGLARGKTIVRAPRDFCGTVAIVLPVGWVNAFVMWGDKFPHKAADVPLRNFLTAMDTRLLWTAPSLVEHGEPEDSMIWGRKVMPIRRVARLFVGDTDLDPLTIEWSGDR